MERWFSHAMLTPCMLHWLAPSARQLSSMEPLTVVIFCGIICFGTNSCCAPETFVFAFWYSHTKPAAIATAAEWVTSLHRNSAQSKVAPLHPSPLSRITSSPARAQSVRGKHVVRLASRTHRTPSPKTCVHLPDCRCQGRFLSEFLCTADLLRIEGICIGSLPSHSVGSVWCNLSQ